MDTSLNKEEALPQSFLATVKAQLHSKLQQFKESTQFKCDKSFTAKATFIAVFGTFLILNGIFGIVMPRSPDIDCIDDKLMSLTNTFNSFFSNNTSSKHALVIIGSLCVDIVFVATVLYWLLFAKTWRFMVAFVVFSVVKVLTHYMFNFSFPEGYVWDYPGFPSLLVSYGKTNTFFYSSYVGIPVICALEWRKNGVLFLMVVCLAVSCFESFTVFVTRAHYSIDIISGLVFAHYFFMLSDKVLTKYVDESWVALEKKQPDIEGDVLAMPQNSVEQSLLYKDANDSQNKV